MVRVLIADNSPNILDRIASLAGGRPEAASDVLAALEGIDLSATVERPGPAVDESNSLDSLAGGVFVGATREDVLSGRGGWFLWLASRS